MFFVMIFFVFLLVLFCFVFCFLFFVFCFLFFVFCFLFFVFCLKKKNELGEHGGKRVSESVVHTSKSHHHSVLGPSLSS